MPAFRFAPAYELPQWPAAPLPEDGQTHDIVIVGGGLAGLTLACDLAQRGVRAVLLDEDNTVGVRGASSRGICYAQKSLEVFERLGIYERIAAKGVRWSVGNTFSGEQKVWSFNLQRDSVSRQPPFINIQQFYVEWFLAERTMELGGVELRWNHQMLALQTAADESQTSTDAAASEPLVTLQVRCPTGDYTLKARWLIDATGVASPIRKHLGLDAHYTSRSADIWCITDVRFKKQLPAERWTWIDAPFNDGRAVWQHPMADDVWRLDYQMGEHVSAEEASRPEVASQRLAAQLGADVDLEIVWIGPYQYRDLLLEQFVHGRVVFIGDAAHVVSPFGARGGNTGIQDANNLGWKLAWWQRGWADASLIHSYQTERHAAAAENLQVTRRTTRFLAPRSAAEHLMRRAAVSLAREHAFARPLVNAGRMSVANAYPPHAGLPDGGVTVQNLPLQWHVAGREPQDTTLMQLLAAQGSRCLDLLFVDAAADSGGNPSTSVERAAANNTAWAASPPANAQTEGKAQDHKSTPSTAGLRRADPTRARLHVASRAAAGIDIVDSAGALAAHLQATPGSCVTVRPDAYRNLCAVPADAQRS
jgi:3-(3-hydroxy-phenyl)propionate hydroxylase